MNIDLVLSYIKDKKVFKMEELSSIPEGFGSYLYNRFGGTNTQYLKSSAILNILVTDIIGNDQRLHLNLRPLVYVGTKAQIQDCLRVYYSTVKVILKDNPELLGLLKNSIIQTEQTLESVNQTCKILDMYKEVLIRNHFKFFN